MSILNSLFGGAKRNKLQSENDQPDFEQNIDLNKVYPRIKGIYDDENPDPSPGLLSKELTLSHEDSPVYLPFAKGIGVFYMADQGDMYNIVQNRHLKNGLTIEKLHEYAVKNLVDLVSEKTEIQGDPENVMMVVNGGNFEATMLLADYFWEYAESVFNDKVCVAIPAKDLMFISAKDNVTGREALRNLIRKYFQDEGTQGLIVRNIYERIEGKWSFVETV